MHISRELKIVLKLKTKKSAKQEEKCYKVVERSKKLF